VVVTGQNEPLRDKAVESDCTEENDALALADQNRDMWSFVAMEYYALILNRTYLVLIDENRIHGIVCRGLTSIENGIGVAHALTEHLAVRGDLNDPKSYVVERQLISHNSANFTIPLSEVSSIAYNPGKKWGMGYYPHDGRVFIQTSLQRRELIILGDQSGQGIADLLAASVERARRSTKPLQLHGIP
jgi:hypothetical protein